MIIKYMWATAQRAEKEFFKEFLAHTTLFPHPKNPRETKALTHVVRNWTGWFLFSIIPLYVKCTSVHYLRE